MAPCSTGVSACALGPEMVMPLSRSVSKLPRRLALGVLQASSRSSEAPDSAGSGMVTACLKRGRSGRPSRAARACRSWCSRQCPAPRCPGRHRTALEARRHLGRVGAFVGQQPAALVRSWAVSHAEISTSARGWRPSASSRAMTLPVVAWNTSTLMPVFSWKPAASDQAAGAGGALVSALAGPAANPSVKVMKSDAKVWGIQEIHSNRP